MKNRWILLLVSLLFSCNLEKSLNLSKVLTDAQPAVDSLAKGAGRNAGEGLEESVKGITQQFLSGLKGATDTLNPDIIRIEKVLDSIGSLSALQLVKLGDTLNIQIARVKGQIDSKKIQKFLVSTLEQLTGKLSKGTKNLLSNMIQTTLDSLNTKASQQKISMIVAGLLNDSAKARVQAFVSGALQPTIDSITNKVDHIVHKDLPFVQREASLLLWSLGILAAAIIGFVWYQRRRYARLSEILTYQINKIPMQGAYDDLTQHISAQTQSENLEQLLRATLKKQGINP